MINPFYLEKEEAKSHSPLKKEEFRNPEAFDDIKSLLE
jgi:hypothetical protein